jgi:hypothetical protein
MDAAQLLVVEPVLWAAVVGIVLHALQLPLPGVLSSVAAALAPANTPLLLLSVGMLLKFEKPQARQVGGWGGGRGAGAMLADCGYFTCLKLGWFGQKWDT